MARLKLFLFGSPQIIYDGEPVEITLRKGLALVVYVTVTGQQHTRDALATLFWPESDQRAGRASLRRTLYRLNNEVAGDILMATAETIGLDPDLDVWLDTEVFTQHVEACLPGSSLDDELSSACISRLSEAARLYTDDFLAGFTLPDSPAFDEWQFFTADGLRLSLARLLDQLAHTYQHSGDYETAIDYARRRLVLDPLHEATHCRLMRLYAWSGQHAAAIRQYQECVRLLEEELGVPPEDETTALYESIRTRRLSEPVREQQLLNRTPASHPVRPTNNLPSQLTSFVGRETELHALDVFIENPPVRLVTIVGTGGMGKTRLALAAAERQVSRPAAFPDGVYFVPLAAVDTVEQIVLSIAEAIDFPFDSGGRQSRLPREQILEYLRPKRVFLVLDNFEHLLDGVDLVTELLQVVPGLKLLVTSRERLYLHEEHVLAIQGLELPEDETVPAKDATEYTAVQLFVQSARRVQHDFAVTEENAVDVIRICRLVEGMPLGVELAASWVDMLTVADIVAEIRASLDFLETDEHNVPTRQRSIRAVFESTWNRLSEEERTTFAQLSVFRGGFTRDAASHVTGTSLRMLAKLAGKSLIQYNKPRDRYQVHELLRQYGADQLATDSTAADAVRDRHSAYFCSALERWRHDIEGANKQTALAAMDDDIDNIFAAWRWAVANGQIARLAQAIDALEHFSYWRGRFHEAEAIFRRASEQLAAFTPSPQEELEHRRVVACLWARHANFNYLLGDWDTAKACYEQSMAALAQLEQAGIDVRSDRAYVLMKLGDLADSPAEARRIFGESLELYRAVGHEWWTAGLLAHLGYVALAAGDHDEASEWFQASLQQYDALGDRWQMGWVLDGMSNVAMHRHELDEAARLAHESLTIHREIGLRDRVADSLVTLSWITLAGGDPDVARALRQEALALWNTLGTSDTYDESGDADAQPFMPRWFSDIIDRRVAAVAATLPSEIVSRALSNVDAPDSTP